METHVKIVGCLLIMLSLAHAFFPRYFKWKMDFSSVALINKEMMYVHAFFIALVLLLMGLLCISSSELLVGSPLGKRISVGFALFWVARLLIQFFGYSSALWKGKQFETMVHISFTLLWVYFSGVFIASSSM